MNETRPDKPIPGPKHVGPDFITEPDYERPMSPALRVARFFADLVRTPAHWVRENIVEPNKGPKYYWYHRKYGRMLPIDECYADDYACIYEANLEYRRIMLVDKLTLELVRTRRDNCIYWWQTTKAKPYVPFDECKTEIDTYQREEDNFFIKYGDLHFGTSVIHAYNKQKHRMIMERRKALADKEKQKEVEMLTGES